MKKKVIAILLTIALLLCLFPSGALAANENKPTNAGLKIDVSGRFYNFNTKQHQYFSGHTYLKYVTVNYGEHPSYTVTYSFKREYNSSYHGYGYHMEILLTKDGTTNSIKVDNNLWVFDRDMSSVSGSGSRTLYPIWTPSLS